MIDHRHGFARSFVTWYDADGNPTDKAHAVTRRCCYCGLGPANMRGVPRAEIDLAHSIAVIHCLWEPGNHNEMIAIAVDDAATDFTGNDRSSRSNAVTPLKGRRAKGEQEMHVLTPSSRPLLRRRRA